MARVSGLSVVINPLALLAHKVQIADLEIDKAQLYLERQADGAANWTFDRKERSDSPDGKWTLDLQKVSLKSVRVQVNDAASKLNMTADLDTLEESDPHGYGIGWKASGSYNGAKIARSDEHTSELKSLMRRSYDVL